MAWTSAFAVDGSRVDAAHLRRLAYQATMGNRGITLPTDLKVTATGTPSGSVNISRGSGVAPSPWRPGESYGVANSSADLFDVPATGSAGGRTEYIVVKVKDHHYDGSQPPADPTVDSYTEVTRVSSLSGLNFPYVPLAKLTIPASTATITNAMISDIRDVARVQSDTTLISRPAVAGDQGLALNVKGGVGEVFPNISDWGVRIPFWATRVHIIANWTSIAIEGGKNPWGQYWVEFGPRTDTSTWKYKTQDFYFDSPGASNNFRDNWHLAAEVSIPASIRDTRQTFVMKARYDPACNDKGIAMTGRSGIDMQIIFLGYADPGLIEYA